MTEATSALKIYEDKVNAQLHEAKLQLEGLEAHTKGAVAQAELDTLKKLHSHKQRIEKKLTELKAHGETKLVEGKADTDDELAKLHAALSSAATKLKGHAGAKK